MTVKTAGCTWTLIFSSLRLIVAIQTYVDHGSLDNFNRPNRQAYYNNPPVNLHFQYQPDLGGWKITWINPSVPSYPSFQNPNQIGSFQDSSPIVGHGSATILPVRYPNFNQNPKPPRNWTASFNTVPAIKPKPTVPPTPLPGRPVTVIRCVKEVHKKIYP
jgi:hypothetical protein